MKKVAIIGTVGIPAGYGGFETLAENLVRTLSSEFEFTVYCSSKAYSRKLPEIYGAKLKYIPLRANGIQSIPYDIWSILSALKSADVLLILGVGGCIVLPFLKLFGCRKKLIVNIDGLEWRRSKWNPPAKSFLKFSERTAVRFCDHVIGDNKVISDYVEQEYHHSCSLIEYGADHQEPQKISAASLAAYPFLSHAYAFGVCRIEPENNVHLVLRAFADPSCSLPLVMVGNWSKGAYGQKLYETYRGHGNIHLLDPVYDQKKLNELRSNCILYIHGHSCGGTNPSLIEAMHLGLPVAAFAVNFNQETTEYKALYFASSEELLRIIGEKRVTEWRKIGDAMREIAGRRYTWKRIGQCYAELF